MPQELVAQARALAGPLDDAGDIRHDEADAVLHVDHPQVGVEGGEMVVGNLGVGPADHAEKGGFAHVGEAHQTYVRQKLQLQHHLEALAGQAALGEAGGLAGGGGEVGVAPAAFAAPAKDEGLVPGHVLDDLARLQVPDQSAPGDPDGEGLAVLTGLAFALAVGAVFRHVFALIAEIHEGGQVVVHLQDDMAARAAVSAVGAARGHVFLPVEGHGAVAAVARLDGDSCFIDERCCHCRPPWCDRL